MYYQGLFGIKEVIKLLNTLHILKEKVSFINLHCLSLLTKKWVHTCRSIYGCMGVPLSWGIA